MPNDAELPQHQNGRMRQLFADAMKGLTGDGAAWRRLRRSVHEIIEVGRGDDKASRLFDGIIVFLILLNVAAFVAETVPRIHAAYGVYLHRFEIFSVAVFTLEYLARLWTSVEFPFLSRLSPWRARWLFLRRPFLIIDLLAILPFYLSQIFAIDLRILRVLRLLRFFKLARYSPAMHTLVRVLSSEAHTLLGAGLLLLAALLVSATGMYYIEGEVQPEKFGSVPDAAYWAMTTLTTVGYGDVTPITPLGKLWAMLTMLGGLCILALPVAIISAGFAQEVGRRDFVVTWSLMSRIPLLRELDTREVAEVMPMLHATNLPTKTEVITAGSTADAMYFVAAGAVKLVDGERSAEYSIGDFFGTVAMLDNDVHSGNFVTQSKCRLLKLYREDFARLERVNPSIGAHIRKVADDRRRARAVFRSARTPSADVRDQKQVRTPE
jgi:voltage-gated potassium channel